MKEQYQKVAYIGLRNNKGEYTANIPLYVKLDEVNSKDNIGDVESEEYAAGITCWFSNPFEPMKNCYNAGIITGKKGYVGGIVGKASGTSLFKCINTNNTFAAETCNQTSCLVGDDTDQAFIDLGFDTSIWKLTGDGRPVFTWENQV